jgi:putative DNA primase/helicase
VERPWLRGSFTHPDLLAWIKEQRAALVHACLTLVAAWIAKGRPDGTVRHGSYARWSKIVGGILKVAGIEDFLGNLDRLYEEGDVERDELRQFLAKWWAKHETDAVSPADLLPVAAEADLFLKGKDDEGRKKSLGWYLRRHKDQTVEIADQVNVRIRRVPGRDALWRLEQGGFSGFSGCDAKPASGEKPGIQMENGD